MMVFLYTEAVDGLDDKLPLCAPALGAVAGVAVSNAAVSDEAVPLP